MKFILIFFCFKTMLLLNLVFVSYCAESNVSSSWPMLRSESMGDGRSRGQGTHGTGKTGKMAQKFPCQGKHREFGNFVKTQGILSKHRDFFLLKW